MRVTRPSTDAIWESGNFVGDQRPITRVTVQIAAINHFTVGKGRWSSALFGKQGVEVELPNVRSCDIDRRVGQDAATCELTFYNQEPLPIGSKPIGVNLDQPGFYTPNRGKSALSARWGHTPNAWSDMLVPNRFLRTYQGYGCDPTVKAQVDPFLDQTGVWMIDSVIINSNKTITVRCRDLAKILIEEICHPPVIPLSNYPVSFASIKPTAGAALPTATGTPYQGGGKVPGGPLQVASGTTSQIVPVKLTYSKSGNDGYVGGPAGKVFGHNGKEAFDSNDQTYWLSIGNPSQDGVVSTEYVEATCPGQDVGFVKFKPKGGGYRVYLSLHQKGGNWYGTAIVPYDRNHPDALQPNGNGADIPYVKEVTVGGEGLYVITLPRAYKNVDRLRLSFRHLAKIDGHPKWRAGVREITAAVINLSPGGVPTGTGVGVPVATGPGQGGDSGNPGSNAATVREGNYDDYTQIVKYFCALGGFYWPKDGDPAPPQNKPDVVVGQGRIWGDFEDTGTSGPSELPASIFDKKPLIDAISYVRDVVSFVFFVDETGAAVWRSPNIWQIGNYVSGALRQIDTPSLTSQGTADPLLANTVATTSINPVNAPATGGSTIETQLDMPSGVVQAAVADGSLPGTAVLATSQTGDGSAPASTSTLQLVTQYLLDRFNRNNDFYIRNAETGHIWKQTGAAAATSQWSLVNNKAKRVGVNGRLWAFAELNASDQKTGGIVVLKGAARTSRVFHLGLRMNVTNTVIVTFKAPQVAGGAGTVEVGRFLGTVYTVIAKIETRLITDVVSQVRTFEASIEDGLNRQQKGLPIVFTKVGIVTVKIDGVLVLTKSSALLQNPNYGQAVGFATDTVDVEVDRFEAQSVGPVTKVAIPPVPPGGLQDLADRANQAPSQQLTVFDTGQSWVNLFGTVTAGNQAYHAVRGMRLARVGTRTGYRLVSLGNLLQTRQDVTTVVAFTTGGFGNYGYTVLRSDAASTAYIQVTVHTGKLLPGSAQSGSVEIGKFLNGVYTKLMEAVHGIADTGFKVRSVVVDDEVTVFINNKLVLQYVDPGTALAGTATGTHCGILSFVPGITYDGFRATKPGTDAGGDAADDYVPNVSSVIQIPQQPTRLQRTTAVRTIDEKKHIKALSVVLDDKNQRSRIFIANQNTDVGAVVSGREPYPMGLERVAIWTDQHFKDQTECLVMADLIALQYRFKQRTARVTIPGNPTFQPDDQVRIFEEVTSETYYHYITGIASRMDMERGVWDMDLETHWLGENPMEGGSWAFSRSDLEPETQQYLEALGKLPPVTNGTVGSFQDPPPPTTPPTMTGQVR